MSTEVRDSFQGIVTNVAEPKAPGYALRIADNVVMRRAGSIELRQGFAPKSLAYAKTGLTFLSSQTHGTTVVLETTVGWKSSGGTTRLYAPLPNNNTRLTPGKFRADQFSSALLRGNHYLPFAKGTLAASAASDTEWRMAGQPLAGSLISASANVPSAAGRGLVAGSQWAYRIVMRRTDANGMVLRSRPSGVSFAQNTSGVNSVVTLSVGAEGPWTDGADTVELYRTRAFPNTVQFDDEMALVAEQPVVAYAFNTFVDDVPDALRGAALYTSPSREGIESQKECPPAAFCIEPYRGSMFYGATVGPQRFIFSVNWANQTGNVAGIGWRTATGNITSGSPTIASVSNTTGLQVGMFVRNGAGTVVGHVISIVGATVTINSNATATTVGTDLTFCDALEVDGTWHALSTNASATATMDFPDSLTRADTSGAADTNWIALEISPALSGYAHTFVIETKSRNETAFAIRGTHGGEMSPPVPLPGVNPASTSAMDSYPNAIQWSASDEPEAVPPANYALIAEKTKWVLGMASTRDSLFIFKEDGIWRLSGYAGQWQIDPFDLTTFCILPSSIHKLNNRIFALTNKGVVAVSELGVQVLSYKIDDQLKYVVDDVRANFASLGYYKITGVDGSAACVDDRNSEYLLNVGTVAHDLGPGTVFVYNERSDAWTTMSFGSGGGQGFTATALGVDENHAPLLMGSALVHRADYTNETTLGVTTRRAYDGTSIAASILSGLDNGDDTATIVVTPATFSVGAFDILSDDSEGIDYEITSVVASNTFTVKLGGNILPTGNVHIFRAYPASVQFHGFLNTPVLGKVWQACVVGFSRLLGPVRLGVAFSSAEPTVGEPSQLLEQDAELRTSLGMAAHHLGMLARMDVPIDHVRSWLLRVKATWLMRRGVVSLDLVSVDARETDNNSPNQNSSGLS